MDQLLALLPYGQYISVAIGIASILATVIPDTNPVGKVIHMLAMAFGKAKNASAAERGE